MKLVFLCLLIGLALFSCKKSEDIKTSPESYDLPWNTEYISYTNGPIGNHGYGYRLFYKHKMIRYEWDSWGGPSIVDSLLINKQILYLLKNNNNMGYSVLYTKDGGISWDHELCGPPFKFKFHIVDTSLVYCTTRAGKNIYFTGLGESYLKTYKDTLTFGLHYISDLGTNTNLDSTIITIGDTAQYVILFH